MRIDSTSYATPPEPASADPTAESLLADNKNLFGLTDFAGVASDLRALGEQDPAAADQLLKDLDSSLGENDRTELYDKMGLTSVESADRFGAGVTPGSIDVDLPLSREDWKPSASLGTVYKDGSLQPDPTFSAAVSAPVAKAAAPGLEAEVLAGQGTVENGNANANFFSRAGNATGRAFDATIGTHFSGARVNTDASADLSANAGVIANSKVALAGLFGTVGGRFQTPLTIETPDKDLSLTPSFGASASAGVGIGGGKGVNFKPVLGPLGVFTQVNKPTASLTGKVAPDDNWEGTDTISTMKAAGADADSPAARQVQEKFTVGRFGMLSMNLAGAVGFEEGITNGEANGTITTAVFGSDTKLESDLNPIDWAGGGKYTTLEDATRFMNEIGRQNEGGNFEALADITPEQLEALNGDKIIEREIDGETVKLLSQENIRTPVFMGADGAEIRDVAEGADGPVRLAGL